MIRKLGVVFCVFMSLFLFIAFILHIAGVTGTISVSHNFRLYISKCVESTSSSTLFIIPKTLTLEYNEVNNFGDIVVNIGKFIFNVGSTTANILSSIWNFQIRIITFIVNLIRLAVEMKPELFEIHNDTWWWRSIGN